MTLRRVAVFFLLVIVVAPSVQAADLGEPYSWMPDWLLAVVDWIHDILGSENPTNVGDAVNGPIIVPTG